jgi:hypothetical protein
LDSAWALGRFGTTPSTGEETGFAWPPWAWTWMCVCE